MRHFNLVDEKWIPVRFPDGTRDELGIRDTLIRSRRITEIEDPSPLVVGALYRFLLAVLYRALEGPTDIERAKSLFREGLPPDAINSYLDRWRDRFWLFDDTHPFGQIPSFEPKTWRAWTALATEHNADNAKVLFDHVDLTMPGTIPEALATRWILSTQTFSVSCGKSELAHTGTAPSATAAMALPIGRTLQDTLIFGLVPQRSEVQAEDRALWERDPETVSSLKAGVERPVVGFADLYTWRIRSVRLDQKDDDGRVAQVAFASGVNHASPNLLDPMLSYRIDEKRGKLPIQFRERGLWRDFDSLLPDEAGLAPLVIQHATSLSRLERGRTPRSVIVFGQANNKAKIEFWRMERFTLPEAVVADRYIREDIHQLLQEAESGNVALGRACRTFARHVLSRGERDPTPDDVRRFTAQMTAPAEYWSSLEYAFHETLRDFTLERDPEDIRGEWLRSVRNILRSVWEQHRSSVATGDAWSIRALVKAESHLSRKLHELSTEIAALEPKKEEVA